MYRRIKGTRDILPDEIHQWQFVESFVAERLELNHYQEIRTPIFEVTELFARSVGQDTDIVTKEMYTFHDKGQSSLTLRPELTAPVIRAYLQNHLEQAGDLTKLYYFGPLFRQERPQKGRLRQFHQFGFEIIGSEHPEVDAEIIQTIYQIYHDLGVRNLNLRLNSIGNRASRSAYLTILSKALKPHQPDFCPTCQKRLEHNILRIFDCKNEKCQHLLDEHAPSILEHLNPEDSQHFEEVKHYLDIVDIPYNIDQKLVRGLDYYTRTTFEISSNLLGAQDAICGGGRYDYLIEDLGGPATPAVGVACGMERLLMVLQQSEAIPPRETKLVYIAALGQAARDAAFRLTVQLRNQGVTTEMDFRRRSLKAQLRQAGKRNADLVAIIGEQELKEGKIQLKNMASGQQFKIPVEDAAAQIFQQIT